MLGLGGYEAQMRADFPEIMVGKDTDTSEESKEILEDIVRRYENETGVRPIW
jgi:hypothetical protein